MTTGAAITDPTALHPLSLAVLNAARGVARDPECVTVVQHQRGDFIDVLIVPGVPGNIGAIIGLGGERIERIRALATEMALAHRLTVRVRIDAPLRHGPAVPRG